MRSRIPLLVLAAAVLPGCAAAVASNDTGTASDERRTAAYLESIRDDPPRLWAFLRAMPKGGDLHSHLGGTVYAESWLRWAAEDGGCVSRRELRILWAPCTATPDTVPAARALIDPELHGAIVDALSMRNWHPSRISGHDQFFATFGRFGPLPYRVADQLAEAQTRAANGGVSFLELMQTADGLDSWRLADAAGWHNDMALMHDTLMALDIRAVVRDARREIDRIEARRDSLLGCGSMTADPACDVTVRWLFQVLRAQTPERVYAHILTGFLLAEADPRVVGVNLVQPEDWHLALRDYSLHMRMIGQLRMLHPNVPVALHAGELAPGLVPPEDLRFHIREAIEVAGARRIGHGVSIMHEPDPDALMRTMKERGVLVEINLTSNDVILGMRGRDHPLHAYIAAGVPVALSTDDEGVARSEMSAEYVKAVLEQKLDYPMLKRMARNSIAYSFVEDAVKSRLLQALDRDFAAFEATVAGRR